MKGGVAMGEVLKLANQKILTECLKNFDKKIQSEKQNPVFNLIQENIKHLISIRKWDIKEASKNRHDEKFIILIKKLNRNFFDKKNCNQEDKNLYDSLKRYLTERR
jgi:hypothetical protein